MEMALREAKARLSELVAEACRGERVVITKYGRPVQSNWCVASGAAGSISTSWKKTAGGSAS